MQRENIQFVEPDMWPPTPDLNPVDYALQQMVYHRQSFASVDELRRAVVKAWEELSHRSWTRASTNGVVILTPW